MPRPLSCPPGCPRSIDDLRLWFTDAFFNNLGIPVRDQLFFIELLLKLLGSCEERRYGEYEYQSWWDFSEATRRSTAYQNFLAKGLTRTLVAARAEIMSARTGGYILLQLLFDLANYGVSVDRVLDGPTNEVWIEPWLRHLDALGVTYQEGLKVTGLRLDGRRIAGVQVEGGEELSADWVVCALPGRGRHDPYDRRDEGGRPSARLSRVPPDQVDERGDVLPRPRRAAWSPVT